MQRLPDFQHHEISDVDDVVDRAQADRFQFGAQPVRARTDSDVLDPARGIERAFVRRGDLHRGAGRGLRFGDLQCPERFFRQRRDFPRQAVVAEEIRAVRRDFDIENGVVREKLADRRANLRLGRQDEQTGRVLRDAEFFRAAKHPLRFHPAQFAFLDLEIARKDRARLGERHLVADIVVLCPANDLARLAAAIVDLADAEPVGIGMRRRSGDLCDDDLGKVRTARFDSFDLDPGEGEQLGKLSDVVRQLHEFAQPVKGKFHDANCPRKRRSFCAKSRMSGMSKRIMASLSIPRPKANPVHFSGS